MNGGTTVHTLAPEPAAKPAPSLQLRMLVASATRRLDRGHTPAQLTRWARSRNVRTVYGSTAQRTLVALLGGAR